MTQSHRWGNYGWTSHKNDDPSTITPKRACEWCNAAIYMTVRLARLAVFLVIAGGIVLTVLRALHILPAVCW